MRRLLTIAAFVVLAALVSASAQRGGMRASGGSHAGSGGHSGFVSHGSAGPRFGGNALGGSRISSGFSHFGPGSRSFARDSHFRGGRFHDRGFRRRCFGCFGNGYPYYSYYDPYWWYDSYSSYNEDDERERQEASEMNAENLAEQRMRKQEQEEDAYAQPRHSRMNLQATDSQLREEARAKADPATVLVFHDQRQREIQNYAIVGQMLWNFTPQRTEKIPLAQLDIPATVKANDDRGVDFRLPRSGEGQ